MSSPSPAARPAPQNEDTQFHRDALNELVAMGMDIARGLHQQAKPQPGTDTPDVTTPFERVARTVRRTIRLAQHIAQPRPTREAPLQARRQILRAVEDTITRTRRGPAAATAHAELLDRLDSPELVEDLDHDIATRPVAEIIAEITRDLGLLCDPGTPYYRRRTPADIHRLNRRAGGHRIPEPIQSQPPQSQPPQSQPPQPPKVEHPPHAPPPAPTRPPLEPTPNLAALAAALLDA